MNFKKNLGYLSSAIFEDKRYVDFQTHLISYLVYIGKSDLACNVLNRQKENKKNVEQRLYELKFKNNEKLEDSNLNDDTLELLIKDSDLYLESEKQRNKIALYSKVIAMLLVVSIIAIFSAIKTDSSFLKIIAGSSSIIFSGILLILGFFTHNLKEKPWLSKVYLLKTLKNIEDILVITNIAEESIGYSLIKKIKNKNSNQLDKSESIILNTKIKEEIDAEKSVSESIYQELNDLNNAIYNEKNKSVESFNAYIEKIMVIITQVQNNEKILIAINSTNKNIENYGSPVIVYLLINMLINLSNYKIKIVKLYSNEKENISDNFNLFKDFVKKIIMLVIQRLKGQNNYKAIYHLIYQSYFKSNIDVFNMIYNIQQQEKITIEEIIKNIDGDKDFIIKTVATMLLNIKNAVEDFQKRKMNDTERFLIGMKKQIPENIYNQALNEV